VNRETEKSDTDTFDSTYGHDRWQAPSFAASWISPPAPRRAFGEDATAPQRSDDHA